MGARLLVETGLNAYELGFLERDRFLEALAGMIHQAPETFWLDAGLLTPEQLDKLLLSSSSLLRAGPERGATTEQDSPSLLFASSVAEGPPSSRDHDEPAPATERPDPPSDETASLAAVGGDPERATGDPETTFISQDEAFLKRFLRVGVLGIGGMGEVSEHEDSVIGRRVAIKRIRARLEHPQRAAAMLEREARVTGRLEHPNIVPLYDMGSLDDGSPYYVMRLLMQPTLAQVLQALRRRDPDTVATFSLNKLVRCFVQVCQAVDYAHSRGVVHCDLKPANILVGAFGEVLVVDWGFCHILGERRAQRGGTPGFLAPEQLDPQLGPIDPRTDVFALGAVLYDILCLHHAFPIQPLPVLIEAVRRGQQPLPEPVRPSLRTPDRRIPAELDEICLRALTLAPAGRYPSARALAEAVEAYLEGTREKERRLARAREFTEQGDTLGEHHREMMLSRPERTAEVDLLRSTIAPWSTPEEKQALWDAEDREAVLRSVGIRTFQAAVAAYEHALDEVSDFPPARLGLARLYWDELQHAEDRRDDFDRVYFEGLVNQYDDGSLGRSSRTEASLQLDAIGDVLSISLSLLGEVGRRLQPVREIFLGPPPARAAGLELGSYLASFHTSEGEVRFPVLLRSGADVRHTVDVRGLAHSAPGEIFVPGGPALLGGHESSLLGRELTRVDVGAFFVDEVPVTFARYLRFVRMVAASEPGRVDVLLPRSEGGVLYWGFEGGELVPLHMGQFGRDIEELLRLPAIGVDLSGAMSYASWFSSLSGRPYRLPTEWEWEKAARGTDGRAYPWGDRFDASLCKMRESRLGPPCPEPSGTFATDVSPYGVRDMAGGVAEWVLRVVSSEQGGPSSSQVASRGGSWSDWRSDCHVASRRPYLAGERSGRVGFRLVRPFKPL
jgi:serine/threonine-protein kinase